MKALDEYFLLVVFTLFLNRVNLFANFMFHLNIEIMAEKGLERANCSSQKQIKLGKNSIHKYFALKCHLTFDAYFLATL